MDDHYQLLWLRGMIEKNATEEIQTILADALTGGY